ncbi:alkylation response protein AidB-like acyl-CoA dehydrogenase [Streptosporangium becharense]|uniref:Alkylation response protein AidB-like acyl-CoA dehydrogenase n=1 Tax=Streptosporangium becharense TaxID=1816182 RepID=A0A7W9IC30_9ACTN|nr:acyl-CoA dehydrogenase family protein [Streptosporangium becharense]MBB2910693.1 alkylation response protein AidB-like acyl-CoA dehydrogenase [Streptosporangium becharense]MBB5817388.1 alkylation response protein AidB-like acyl-CoA dehydrogenase [Streptosporangium becharense]
MRFALSEEQSELSAVVGRVLRRRGDGEAVRRAAGSPAGYDEGLWGILCEQIGVAALAVPEEFGGAGFSLVETHVVLERLGYALTPSPLLGSGVLGAQAILRSGDDAACARLLPGVAAGTTLAALAWATADGRWHRDRSDVRVSGEGRLTGSAHLVLDGAAADVLLVVGDTGEGAVGLYEVAPEADGVHRVPTPGMDLTLRFARVDFDSAPARLLAADAAALLAGLRDVAAVAVTALQVGAAQRGLDMTVAHTGQRVQFGRPIGSFQALKHRMADMLVLVETSRTISRAAAWSAARGTPDLPERAATAKAWCSDALNEVAAETIQLHGGIAITWEHDAHLVFKRAHATSQLFGQPHEWRRRLFEHLRLATG